MLALKLKKEDLAKGVSQTSAIAEKRSAMPILSNILLEAADGRLRLTATDMEISFQGSYPAEVSAPGQITAPAKKFNELVRNLDGDEVSLAEEANFNLLLSAGRFSAQMNGLPPADFPRMPAAENMGFIEMDGPALAGVIDKTIFSVAGEETRYNLGGVFMEKVEYEGRPNLRLVSTDGSRLNLAALHTPDLARLDLPKGVLIPRKGLMELKDLAKAAEAPLQLGVSGGNLAVKGANYVLVMRLLDGRFPDYNMVIPKDNDKILSVGRRELLEALRRIAPMCSGEYKVVKFQLEPGRLIISTMTPNLGKAEEDLEVEYDGAALETGFNPVFFMEALGVLASEKVKLGFLEAANPVLLTAPEDPGYSGVIMSMKI